MNRGGRGRIDESTKLSDPVWVCIQRKKVKKSAKKCWSTPCRNVFIFLCMSFLYPWKERYRPFAGDCERVWHNLDLLTGFCVAQACKAYILEADFNQVLKLAPNHVFIPIFGELLSRPRFLNAGRINWTEPSLNKQRDFVSLNKLSAMPMSMLLHDKCPSGSGANFLWFSSLMQLQEIS